ncbi:MAG: tyrosine-type recombinase/integrase [Chloroflexota bacterium]
MTATLSEALAKFLKIKRASMRSEATIKWYTSVLSAMSDNIGHTVLVSDVSDDDLVDYITELRERDQRYVDEKQKPTQAGGLRHESIRTHIRALKSFWKWCSKSYGIANPMDAIPMPRRRDPQPKSIDPSDFCKLMDATLDSPAGIRDRAILALLADTGVRAGGILSLQVETIDAVRGRGRVLEKGYKERWVYWSHHTSLLVQKWMQVRESHTDSFVVNISTGEPLTYSGLAQMLKRLKKRAKVRGRVNAHAFRHNFARMYLIGGGDLVTLARLLGHSDVNVTAAYYAVFADNELADLQKKYSPVDRMLD